MDMNQVKMQLLALIATFSQGIPFHQAAGVRDLGMAGEAGVAFENFCTQLYEWERGVTAVQYETLKRLGTAMGICSACWEVLEVN
jgi:hypothetical protein